MQHNLPPEPMFAPASSYPFQDVASDRHSIHIPLYNPSPRHPAVFHSPMDELILNYSYKLSLNDHNPEQYYICSDAPQPQIVETQALPLYAPVPSQGHGPAFMHPDFVYRDAPPGPSDVYYRMDGCIYDTEGSPGGDSTYSDAYEEQGSPASHYSSSAHLSDTNSLQPTFLTPSELLAELAEKGPLPVNSLTDEFGSDVRSESASKARRRAMAKCIGFVPTDPDSISSHEKKRQYLESLEQYVLYLHEQLELVGASPERIKTVQACKGLSSKSIRTLLVHMSKIVRKLNQRTIADELKYVTLSQEIARREALLADSRKFTV